MFTGEEVREGEAKCGIAGTVGTLSSTLTDMRCARSETSKVVYHFGGVLAGAPLRGVVTTGGTASKG